MNKEFCAEFNDYPVADLPPMPDGFADSSWHNDTCPSYMSEALNLQIFMDYADAAKRECATDTRFSVIKSNDDGSAIVALCTNEWRDVIEYVNAQRETADKPFVLGAAQLTDDEMIYIVSLLQREAENAEKHAAADTIAAVERIIQKLTRGK